MNQYRVVWGYGQRYWLEVSIVLSVIGILVYLQLKIGQGYIIAAELVEPMGMVQDMRTQMALHSAITGQWPEAIVTGGDETGASRMIKSYQQFQDGHVMLHLISKKPEINNQLLAFNLYENNAGQGYKMYIWHCGGVVAPKPYITKNPLRTTLSTTYTNVLCRNNYDRK